MKLNHILIGLGIAILLCSSVVAGEVDVVLHSQSPTTLETDYTGCTCFNYLVNSTNPLNLSSLAFLSGVNYTITNDYHSSLRVPANDISNEGIYRAQHRNITPYLSWEFNDTITEGNVWKWGGGDNDSEWITTNQINSTHTWVNISGRSAQVFQNMHYLGQWAQYEAPMTGFEINRAQGLILRIYDLEQYRNRSYDYYINTFFDTSLESTTPTNDIEIWYCNCTFDPATDDPTAVCDYKDTWDGTRWTNHTWSPSNNTSFAYPMVCHAATATCPSSPCELNYVYLRSGTVASRSYILNASNGDPGVCNRTFAQTDTMWTYNEMTGTSTPIAYTPSMFQTFTRDYEQLETHLYVADTAGEWGHSDIAVTPIGFVNILPTHTRYNYFWRGDGFTDYDMDGTYKRSFWLNVTYGFDPDNGASVTHVLSLYTEGGEFVTVINDSLVGNQTDDDVYFDLSGYAGHYRFYIVSTDNEGTSTTSMSPVFTIIVEMEEETPLILFVVLMVLLFGALFYIYHAQSYIAKIVTALISTWMSFMLSAMIVSNNVVINYAELAADGTFVYGAHPLNIAALSHFFMFTGVVSALFMLVFAVKLVIDTYLDMQERKQVDEEWDGVE